jgi:hypothetical protein
VMRRRPAAAGKPMKVAGRISIAQTWPAMAPCHRCLLAPPWSPTRRVPALVRACARLIAMEAPPPLPPYRPGRRAARMPCACRGCREGGARGRRESRKGEGVCAGGFTPLEPRKREGWELAANRMRISLGFGGIGGDELLRDWGRGTEWGLGGWTTPTPAATRDQLEIYPQ